MLWQLVNNLDLASELEEIFPFPSTFIRRRVSCDRSIPWLKYYNNTALQPLLKTFIQAWKVVIVSHTQNTLISKEASNLSKVQINCYNYHCCAYHLRLDREAETSRASWQRRLQHLSWLVRVVTQSNQNFSWIFIWKNVMNCCCHNCKVNRNLNLQLKRTICICWLRENGVPIQWDFNLLKIQQIKNGIKWLSSKGLCSRDLIS